MTTHHRRRPFEPPLPDTKPFALFVFVVLVALLLAGCGEREPEAHLELTAEPADASAASFQDAWITTKIRGQYFTDADVGALHIVVHTADGVVTLRGFVDDARSREQAVAIARNTDGVRDVVDELIENPERAAGGPDLRDTMADVWLMAKIQSRYFGDPDVRSSTVDVTTANGVVLLTGAVESDESRQKAFAIASETEGVSSVIDWLQVGVGPPGPAARAEDWMTDRAITTRVQSKFFLDPEVKGRRIDVETAGGVVTLAGRVGSEPEEQQALALARGTYGVKDVVDRLEIAEEPARPDAGRIMTDIGATMTDAWITARVKSKFFLDEQVRGRDISVNTANGIVTLSGVVPSADVKQRAADMARATPGVRDVIDQVTVAASRT